MIEDRARSSTTDRGYPQPHLCKFIGWCQTCITMNGFWWGRFKWTYLDVRVFNPLAASNSNTDISKGYRKHENEKKRIYEQKIWETEHSSFTLLMFSTTAGMDMQTSNRFLPTTCCNVSWTNPMGQRWIGCTAASLSPCWDLPNLVYLRSTLIQGQPHEGAAPGGLGHFWIWDFLKLFCCHNSYIIYIFVLFNPCIDSSWKK